MARTNNLSNFLTDVADAIRTKKGSEEPIAAADFDTEIENLPSGGDLSEYFNAEPENISSSEDWLQNNYLIKVPDIVVPSNVTDLTKFAENYGGVIIPKIIATGNIQKMMYMCQNSQMASFDGTSINTSNILSGYSSSFGYVFYNCDNLVDINISNWDVTNITDFRSMFRCAILEELDLSGWELGKTKEKIDARNMFQSCPKLKKLDIRKFNLTNMTYYAGAFSGLPKNCEIIVADDSAKTWMNEKFSNLTNIKTVAEYEAEQNA